MILMRNGDWLTYANVCRKETDVSTILFLARASEDVVLFHLSFLRRDDCVEDGGSSLKIGWIRKTHYLRMFDGQSDECLQKTWPTHSR